MLVASLVLLEGVLQIGALFFKAPPPDLGADVDPESVRVLAVGDSWVEGAEAPDGEGFVDHLGRELSSVAQDAPIQLFNLGRTGANSAHVALTTMDEVPRVQPALILVLVGQNNASNFYRVAEVEERIGVASSGSERWYDRFKVVKLARILAATARGGSGYEAEATPAPEISIPALQRNAEGDPVYAAPLLATDAGRGYLLRAVWDGVPTSGSKLRDLAWEVLYATARRDLGFAATAASRLGTELGWSTTATTPSAPLAATETELLARFAMMRLARQERQWRAVRYHAGAAEGYAPRGAVSDLMAAEAHLLGGDWEGARRYLLSAHNQAPGFLDIIDAAARFPEQARDPDLFEALEWPPAALELPAYEQAEVLRYAQFNPDGATLPYAAWTELAPSDLPIRVDLAVWLLEHGRHLEADSLMGVRADAQTGHLGHPNTAEPQLWRFAVARALSTGDRDHAFDVVVAALDQATPRGNADLLEQATRALSAHEYCELLGDTADRWFEARGDGNTYAQLLAPCVDRPDAAARLRALRVVWGPLGRESAWTALVRAGRKPFELLYRDLDLVVTEAGKVQADVVILNYPNPSEDHTALRQILADYAATRPVGYVDLWGRFDRTFTREEWALRLGPNGHCNARGYREMADGVLEWLASEGILSGGAPAQ